MLCFRLLENLEVVFHTYTPWGKKTLQRNIVNSINTHKPNLLTAFHANIAEGYNVQIIMVNIQNSEISNMI